LILLLLNFLMKVFLGDDRFEDAVEYFNSNKGVRASK
jgi:hypothetical protein